MRHRELKDAEWKRIAKLVTTNQGRGRSCRDRRIIVNGILWVLSTGATWRDLPVRFGAWQTVYDVYRDWQKSGTWQNILLALNARQDEHGRIVWESFVVDTGFLGRGRSAAAHRSINGGKKHQ